MIRSLISSHAAEKRLERGGGGGGGGVGEGVNEPIASLFAEVQATGKPHHPHHHISLCIHQKTMFF